MSFHFGLPAAPLLARAKAWGAVVLASATTPQEARWLEDHGADAVIAQGLEAGGHRGHFLAEDADLADQMDTLALVRAVAPTASVPVIAAGGIVDAQTSAAARAAGAAGVQAGTAFLACPEATTSAVHRARLAQARQNPAAAATAITNVFTGRPARGLVNVAMRELGPMSKAAPRFPGAAAGMAPLRAAAEARGSGEYSPLWAGSGVAACRERTAAEVVSDLAGPWRDAR
jgi:nitronate monooxygenase